jgi:hypothetical protein
MEPKRWPAMIDEAVGVVIATLSDEDKWRRSRPWRSPS